MSDPASALPEHIEQTLRAIAELHARHHREASPIQHAVDRMTAFVARPRFVWMLTLAAVVWVAVNVGLTVVERRLDPPPFAYFEIVGTWGSVYITVLILITQTRQSRLSERRDQLTLELAMLNEQKSAKIIELLQDLRRDHPDIADRHDPHADALSSPADPHAMLAAIENSDDGDTAGSGLDR